MSDGFPYKKVLIIGATSGIGRALADRMLGAGISVIGVGRRQDRLDEFVKAGGSKASSSVFDITKVDEISGWATSIQKAHPDLDFVLVNSGIQRGYDFSRPDTIDFSLIENEFLTNYLAYLRLAVAFTPFLQQQASQKPAGIAFTTSGLALLPLLRCPNYCASKAALHHWILIFREQNRKSHPNLKVVELLPPAVQTELHNADKQPDIKDGHTWGMPLKEFTDRAWAGFQAGKEQIPVGLPEPAFEPDGFETQRQNMFRKMNGVQT